MSQEKTKKGDFVEIKYSGYANNELFDSNVEENLKKLKADNDEWEKSRIKQMEIDKKALVESAKDELASLAILAAEKIMENKNK